MGGKERVMDDLISRQEMLDGIDKLMKIHFDRTVVLYKARQVAENLPSAQPERKTGRWIKTARWGRVYYCNQCRNYLDFDGVNAGRGNTNFCPNCGADMRGEQE